VRLAPRKVRRQHLAQAVPGVDTPRVHIDKGRRPRHADIARVETMLVPEQVHHVGGIGGIEEREPRLQAERLCAAADELMGDSVKGTAPKPAPPLTVADQGRGSSQHVVGCTPCEGQEQDLLWCHASIEQPGYSRCQRSRLAGTGSGHDHEWIVPMDHRGKLRPVKAGVPSRFGVHTFDLSALPAKC